MRIANNSVSVIVRSFGLAPTDEGNIVVWLEIAPQHPKVVGAIWASLVNGAKETLYMRTDDSTIQVQGIVRRYHRLTMDAPHMAARARPKFLRLIAPEACAIQRRNADFIVLEWPRVSVGTALAAMLEKGTPYPIQIGWGDYLLRAAIERECAKRLITGGPAPQGYLVSSKTPWGEIISEGLKQGHITLQGETLCNEPMVGTTNINEATTTDIDEDEWKREVIARDVAVVARNFNGPVEIVGADETMQTRIQQLLSR